MTDPQTPSAKSPGRPGLQRKDVADAIDTLVERGIRDPSLVQLRQQLGRGSNGTISRLRSEIRGERLLATRAPVEGSVESAVLPTLVSAMERLGEEAARAADDQVAQMRTTFEEAQSTLSREREEAVSAAHDIRIELTARADQVKDLRETVKALRSELADEKRRLDRSESTRHKVEEKTHTLSAELERMTNAHDQLDKALSNQKTVLEQVNTAQDALKKEHKVLTDANAELEGTITRQSKAADQHQTLIEELRTTKSTLEQQVIEAEQGRATITAASAATIDGLEARLTDQQRVIDSLIDKVGE